MEYVNIYSVRSTARLLEALKGKMISVGTSLEAKQTVKEFALAHKNQKKPYLIILGNEEHGISDVVQKNCDELVIIPWAGMTSGVKESLVDSLNVAQAASVIFYELA